MKNLINSIFWGLIWEGVCLIIFGILIFVFKDLLNILVASFLVAAGIVAILWAFSTRRLAK